MKKLIFVMFSGALVISCLTAKTVTFSESENLTIVFDDIKGSKDHLYLKANTWMVGQFNSAKSVIQFQDKTEGTIIGRYLMRSGIDVTRATGYGYSSVTSYDASTEVYAIIDIRIKDDKIKFEIKPQSEWKTYTDGTANYEGYYTKEKAKADMKRLADSFHSTMLKQEGEF